MVKECRIRKQPKTYNVTSTVTKKLLCLPLVYYRRFYF